MKKIFLVAMSIFLLLVICGCGKNLVDADEQSNVEETKEEEVVIRQQAHSLEEGSEPRLLAAFKRIRKGTRNGLGVVAVKNAACGGCFNRLTPQRQLDIRMRKKVIVCEYCGRILVDPEMVDPEY